MCLAAIAYPYKQLAAQYYYFSTGGKFQQVSNFTYLHALTLATHSYVLLMAVYMRYRSKHVTGELNLALSTYRVVVFCFIQHILQAFYVSFCNH